MGRVIRSGVYCGPLEHLVGERALLLDTAHHCLMEDDASPDCFAQFNNTELKLCEKNLGYSWTRFLREDFTDLYITDTL